MESQYSLQRNKKNSHYRIVQKLYPTSNWECCHDKGYFVSYEEAMLELKALRYKAKLTEENLDETNWEHMD